MTFLQLDTIRRNWRAMTLTTALSWLMKLLMAGLVPVEVYRGEYLFALAIAFAVLLSLVPSLVERNYNVTLPFEFDLLITLSLFLHTFFGEGFDFYEKYWFWDKALHLYGGGVVGLIAFVGAYTLHYTRKVRLTIPFIGFFTVTFAVAVGGMWEVGEFAVDELLGKNTQKGLDNTMWDLINDLAGGVVAAVLGMVYVRASKPMIRKRLDKPVGEVMGIGEKVDRLKERMEGRKGVRGGKDRRKGKQDRRNG